MTAAAYEMPDYEARLEEKLMLLRRILELTQKNPDLLAADDVERLQTYTRERKRLSDEIDALKIRPEHTAGRKARASLKTEQEIEQVLASILSLDALNITLAQKKLEEYRCQIKRIQMARKGALAYEKLRPVPEGVFFDRKK
jgi:hypothetical protein